MKSVYCKYCGAFLFGIKNKYIYYATKCKKCGKMNIGKSEKPKKSKEK